MSSGRCAQLGVAAILVLSCSAPAASAAAEQRVPQPVQATHPMDALTPDEISASAAILRAAGKLGPVSYTHLDVYKRQTEYNVLAGLSSRSFGRFGKSGQQPV